MTTDESAISHGVATDVGRVRQHNEDSARVAGTIFVVADGMGGHAAGEVASGIATDALMELAERPVLRARDLVEQLAEANRRILESAARHPEQTGMGTTVAGLALVSAGASQHWVVFNIGDSRVYRLIQGQLSQVTVDHSEVQELVDRGIITAEQAQRHPGRNVITRSLGRDPMGHVDTWVFPPYPGESFVICTDGLTNELEPSEIEAVLLDVHEAQEAADELVRRAVTAGGRDNVTAVVVSLQGQESDADVDEDTSPRESIGRSRSEAPAAPHPADLDVPADDKADGTGDVAGGRSAREGPAGESRSLV
ncbi:MAG TPA: PP2C family serine/threonine-protein phosphatase [Intrasporangium sp.]|uniref:PP2C family protein-serine/threonine phosphatase n=1 Tax=Intrasporangium sp. TaxID=1925024 RepID=UPI002B46D7CD|nr:PP2C family serine/threonine-protein phosphatase [Intrasporangium sp.]HKX67597.1 PP2C family serine/threonine-protein phosphatase [Intrasporangium sp.]